MKLNVSGYFSLRADYQLRPLVEADVNEDYIGWLNDPETTKYLTAVRLGGVTLADQKEYVRRIIESADNGIFGLFNSYGELIGTSGVQKVGAAEDGPWVGILIGRRQYRHMGLGAALVWMVTRILFLNFKTEKVYAGTHRSNVASYKAFLKVGYVVDAVAKSKFPYSSEEARAGGVIVSCSSLQLASPERLGLTHARVAAAGTGSQWSAYSKAF